MQVTFHRPTSDTGYSVSRHASSISLAVDDQVTVASLQIENANLRRQVAAQGGRTETGPPASAGGRAASIVSGLGSVAGTTSGGSGERQDNPNFCEEKFGWARDAAQGGPGTPRMILSGQLSQPHSR